MPHARDNRHLLSGEQPAALLRQLGHQQMSFPTAHAKKTSICGQATLAAILVRISGDGLRGTTLQLPLPSPDVTSDLRSYFTAPLLPPCALLSLFVTFHTLPLHWHGTTSSCSLNAVGKHEFADLDLLALTACLHNNVGDGGVGTEQAACDSGSYLPRQVLIPGRVLAADTKGLAAH